MEGGLAKEVVYLVNDFSSQMDLLRNHNVLLDQRLVAINERNNQRRAQYEEVTTGALDGKDHDGINDALFGADNATYSRSNEDHNQADDEADVADSHATHKQARPEKQDPTIPLEDLSDWHASAPGVAVGDEERVGKCPGHLVLDMVDEDGAREEERDPVVAPFDGALVRDGVTPPAASASESVSVGKWSWPHEGEECEACPREFELSNPDPVVPQLEALRDLPVRKLNLDQAESTKVKQKLIDVKTTFSPAPRTMTGTVQQPQRTTPTTTCHPGGSAQPKKNGKSTPVKSTWGKPPPLPSRLSKPRVDDPAARKSTPKLTRKPDPPVSEAPPAAPPRKPPVPRVVALRRDMMSSTFQRIVTQPVLQQRRSPAWSEMASRAGPLKHPGNAPDTKSSQKVIPTPVGGTELNIGTGPATLGLARRKSVGCISSRQIAPLFVLKTAMPGSAPSSTKKLRSDDGVIWKGNGPRKSSSRAMAHAAPTSARTQLRTNSAPCVVKAKVPQGTATSTVASEIAAHRTVSSTRRTETKVGGPPPRMVPRARAEQPSAASPNVAPRRAGVPIIAGMRRLTAGGKIKASVGSGISAGGSGQRRVALHPPMTPLDACKVEQPPRRDGNESEAHSAQRTEAQNCLELDKADHQEDDAYEELCGLHAKGDAQPGTEAVHTVGLSSGIDKVEDVVSTQAGNREDESRAPESRIEDGVANVVDESFEQSWDLDEPEQQEVHSKGQWWEVGEGQQHEQHDGDGADFSAARMITTGAEQECLRAEDDVTEVRQVVCGEECGGHDVHGEMKDKDEPVASADIQGDGANFSLLPFLELAESLRINQGGETTESFFPNQGGENVQSRSPKQGGETAQNRSPNQGGETAPCIPPHQGGETAQSLSRDELDEPLSNEVKDIGIEKMHGDHRGAKVEAEGEAGKFAQSLELECMEYWLIGRFGSLDAAYQAIRTWCPMEFKSFQEFCTSKGYSGPCEHLFTAIVDPMESQNEKTSKIMHAHDVDEFQERYRV
eukprot:GEMP01012053.1.p1 GENE.GEMP01012053.1~~GEMP01012053.1.p1  ORF type:complete len:1008 (+),score=230.87 GEMP01012053.1:87-3110(+)